MNLEIVDNANTSPFIKKHINKSIYNCFRGYTDDINTVYIALIELSKKKGSSQKQILVTVRMKNGTIFHEKTNASNWGEILFDITQKIPETIERKVKVLQFPYPQKRSKKKVYSSLLGALKKRGDYFPPSDYGYT